MLYLHDIAASFLPPSIHLSPLDDSCVSAGSSLLRGDMTLQAKQADKVLVASVREVCLLFCVLPLAAKCLLSHHEGICVRAYASVCVFLISFRLLQIGTGFKDEDLEQHYKFLKVKWHAVAVALTRSVKITTSALVFSH